MSCRSFARVAALLSAIALAVGGAAVTTPAHSTVVAGACCTGHN